MARKSRNASQDDIPATDAVHAEPVVPPAEGPQAPVADKGGNGGGRNAPAHVVRFGRVKATVWANHSQAHGRWFSITLSRTFFDEKARQHKSAQSFGKDDLLVVAEACRQAFLWVAEQQQHQGQTNTDDTNETGIPI